MWDLPWATYRGRTRGELSLICRRLLVLAVALWVLASSLFAASALDLIPGFGPEENVWVVLASLVLGTAAIMATSVWSNIDRALRGEPRVDPEWARWYARPAWQRGLVPYVALIVVGVLFALAVSSRLTRSVENLLALAGFLILALLLLIVGDRLRRRR